ncbi:hypothetical protein FBU30_002662 [Linnemannia zychae]|nr:hypothetical protein FBU30_002662 [Linnemannia zychae]
MSTTPTRSRESSPSIFDDDQQQQQQQQHELKANSTEASTHSSNLATVTAVAQKESSSRATVPRFALPLSQHKMVEDSEPDPNVYNSTNSRQQEDNMILEQISQDDDAEEMHTPQRSTSLTTKDMEKENILSDKTIAESPFLVFSPGMINIRRQGGNNHGESRKESGLNCSTPTRSKHSTEWIGDLFSRGRLTRSRRTQNDDLVELDHDSVVAQEILEDDIDDDDNDDNDDNGDDREGEISRGSRSPVTPRSQFGRWKYCIMMSQSTMKPPKLNQDDAEALDVDNVGDGEDQGENDELGSEFDEADGVRWPYGDSSPEADQSTPKRKLFKIPQRRLRSPSSPSLRDSGCDDDYEDNEDAEEAEDDLLGSIQDNILPKDTNRTLSSFSSEQEQLSETEHNDTGMSSSSTRLLSTMKPPKLNLRHLEKLFPSSPSESSSSFHTPPRKRVREDMDGIGQPPPAPKLVSPEQVLQYLPASQSPSVLKSLQLRHTTSALDGPFQSRTSTKR